MAVWIYVLNLNFVNCKEELYTFVIQLFAVRLKLVIFIPIKDEMEFKIEAGTT